MPRFLPRITPSARRIPERCLDWCNPADYEIYGKRLQILKEAVPSASDMRTSWEGGDGQGLREAGQRLEMSVIGIPLDESTPSEYQRVFGEIAKERPDAIMTHDIGELTTYHQLMLTLSKKAVCRRFAKLGQLGKQLSETSPDHHAALPQTSFSEGARIIEPGCRSLANVG
jgi:hypothetical protein